MRRSGVAHSLTHTNETAGAHSWGRRLMGLAAVGTLTGGLVVAATSGPATADATPPAGAVIVSNAGGSGPCATPSATSIQAAVNAASSGATIYVCAGTYNESLTIDKPLVLDGAEFGVDARTRSANETVIDGAGGITYTAGATSGTVSGFTLDGYTGGTGEIQASDVGSGWTFNDNIIDVSDGGIYLNTDGQDNPSPSTIDHNQFVQSTPSEASSGDDGQAVLLWANTANNVTVSDNDFVNLSGPGAGINTTGTGNCSAFPDAGTFSNDLTVSGNSFTDDGAPFTDPANGPGSTDENFLALFCTSNAQIDTNTVTITDANDSSAETPIYLGGGDWGTTVHDNTLSGDGASNASGINLNSDFYPPGTGVSITGNTVSGFLDGIHVRDGEFGAPGGATPSDFTIDGNEVTSSTSTGIDVSDGVSGTITNNTVSGSTNEDCEDDSSGSGTAGTADSWAGDVGSTSAPAGLCQAPVRVASTPVNGTIAVGQADNDVVTVTGNATGGSPTGTVSFYACGPTSVATACTATVAPVGSAVALSPGPGPTATATSGSFTPSATGFWCFGAVYSGDTTYSGGADTSTGECVDVTSAGTSIATSPTSASIALGLSDTDNVAVTGNATAGSPTGTVRFFSCGPTTSGCTPGSTPVGGPGALVPAAGNGATATSPPFTPPSAGSWCFAVSYSGDSNYSAQFQGGAAECFTVAQVTTSTATTPTQSTVVLGAGDTDKATVTGTAAAGSPTGTVSFYQCGETSTATPCTSTAHPVGSAVPVTAGPDNTATATSPTFTPTSAGFWCFQGIYSGDADNAGSADTRSSECVQVTKASTSAVTAPTSATIVAGTSDTDGITVTGNSAGGPPTGTVSFYRCGPTTVATPCTSTSHPVGSAVAVSGASSTTATATSPAFEPTSTGFWCFAGVYSGDGNYTASSDATVDECVDVTKASSGTVSAPSQTTFVLGNSATDGVRVTGTAIPGDPTGPVSFYQCGPTTVATPCTSTANQVGGAVTLTAGTGASATASSGSFTPTATGFWCFAAVYGGDANYLGSADTTVDECVDVTAATTTTRTVPTSFSIPLGTSDTDGATVAGTLAGGAPTGTVQFYQCGPTTTPTPCTSTAHPVGSGVAVTGDVSDTSSATSPSFTPTGVGYWCFAGVYSGDGNYQTSADASTDECVQVTRTISSTVTTPTNATITLGQADNDLATVTGNAAGGSPTGTVSFYECGPSTNATPCASTANPVGSAVTLTPGPNDTATVTSPSFTPTATGFTCFTADYSGDGSYFASSDTTMDECVDVVSSGDTVTTSAPTTSSFVLGGSDTDGATVTGNPAGGSPTGTVSFYVCGPTGVATPCTSTAHPVGSAVALTGAANAKATATSASFTPTGAGFWCFASDYSGGTSYFASADTSTDECFDVTPAASATGTVPTSSTLRLGATNTDSVAVTGNATAGAPTGTVTFYACGPTANAAPCTSIADPVGSPVHLTVGSGVVSTAVSPPFTATGTGTWCFAGVYSGGTNYLASGDETTDECFTVTAASSATTSAPSQTSIVIGSSVTDGATVTGNGAGGTPTGTVRFYQCGPTTTATACTSTANPVGGAVSVVAGVNDTATAGSAQFTPTSTGFWCFGALYSGGANYLASSDQTTDECVDVLTAAQQLTIVTSALPAGTKGTPYSFTLTASGGVQPYTWSSTKMPPGVGLNRTTGVIAGTPKRVGTFKITIRVKDKSKPKKESASVVLTLVVSS